MSDVLEQLARAGFVVSSVDELRRSGVRYSRAVPILIGALGREVSFREKEWIVRALTVPWARPTAVVPLVAEFRSLVEDDSDGASLLRWAIGNALDVLWDDSHFDDFVSLARDARFGRSREMLVLGFAKSKRVEESVNLLLELVDDPDVDGHAIAALAKLRHPASRGALVAATQHPKTWVRKRAQRGLSRLGAE